jgi:hypothetical protein
MKIYILAFVVGTGQEVQWQPDLEIPHQSFPTLFLHYVLDVWLEEEVKPRPAGHDFLIRFAEDYLRITSEFVSSS